MSEAHHLLNIPNALCAVRIVGSPYLIVLAWMNRPFWCLGLYLFLFLTDWLDGKLARLLGQRTIIGARLDSAADALLYACALPAMAILKWDWIRFELVLIGVAVLSYAANIAASAIKFRRLPSYHTWLAKTSWLLIGIAVLSIFAGWSVWPLRVALGAVILTNMEQLAITFLLSDWQVDVHLVSQAISIRKSQESNSDRPAKMNE